MTTLRLVHPKTAALAKFDYGDIKAFRIFCEYIIDGWLPAGLAEERFAEQILAAQADKEASLKGASHAPA